jgi:hypothetical protein
VIKRVDTPEATLTAFPLKRKHRETQGMGTVSTTKLKGWLGLTLLLFVNKLLPPILWFFYSLGLYYLLPSLTDWAIYKEEKLTSHSSRCGKSNIKTSVLKVW